SLAELRGIALSAVPAPWRILSWPLHPVHGVGAGPKVPLSDGGPRHPNARHPRARPGDLMAGSHGVCGGCQTLPCPFLREILGTGPRMTAWGKEVLATRARMMGSRARCL